MKKVRFGVIGAGGIARTRTIPGILKAENAELAAIMNVNPDSQRPMLEDLAARGSHVRGYLSVEELLSDEEVDAVYIASPVYAHREQVEKAAKAGKHVLLEKPMGLSVSEAQAMVEVTRSQRAADGSSLKAQVAFMMRFHTYHQQIRKAIAEGLIGQVVSARAQQIFWYPELPNCWRQSKALGGGGALMDVGVHNIDLIEYVTGSRTKSVVGFTETRTFSYDSDDVSNLLIRLENGAVAYIDGAFNMRGTPGGNLLEIYGTKGSILAQGTIGQQESGKIDSIVIDERGNRSKLDFKADFSDLYQKEIEAFSGAVLQDTKEPIPIEDGLWIQRVAAAAYLSQEEKRIVSPADCH